MLTKPYCSTIPRCRSTRYVYKEVLLSLVRPGVTYCMCDSSLADTDSVSCALDRAILHSLREHKSRHMYLYLLNYLLTYLTYLLTNLYCDSAVVVVVIVVFATNVR